MSEIKNTKQEILTGSARLFSQDKKPFDRVNYMIENMHLNKAYFYQSKKTEIDKSQLLNNFKEEYKNYNQIRNILNEINSNLSIEKRIRKFYLLEEPFSIDNLLLTPTLKMKRISIAKKYNKEINEMY